jgi:Protein of unknown function (DUF1641)
MTLAPSRHDTAQAALSAKLDDPAVVESLLSLLDHADLLAIIVAGLDGFVARSEVIGDSVIDSVAELRTVLSENTALADSGVDVKALVEAGVSLAAVLPEAAPGMVAAVRSGALDTLFASGVLGPEAIGQVAVVAAGLVQGGRDFAARPVEVGGPVSVLRLLKDPDVNRTISYFATVARAIGRELATTSSTRQQ